MSQKFRVREIAIKSQALHDSGIILENITAATPIDTAAVPIGFNNTSQKLVRMSNASGSFTSRVHLDSGTLETGKVYPSYNGSFTAADAYVSIELPVGAATLTLSEVKAILHKDVARTDIVLDLTKNGVSFQTLTMPTGTSTLTIANTTTFADSDKFAVVVTTGVASSTIGAEIFISYTLS